MEVEIEEFEFTKRIAFFVSFIRDELRGTKKALSDKDIAKLLSSQGVRNFELKGQQINRIANAGETIRPNQQSKWWACVDSIVRKHNLQIDLRDELPIWLEDRFVDNMPAAYRLPSPMQQGEALGEMANILHGLWHFFYLSPINRQGELEPEIRGTAAIFLRAGTESHSIRLQVLSGHGFWKGAAFLNDSHLYLSCTLAQKIETAFFVTSRPDKRSYTIAGTGAALERHKEQGKPHATAGFVCFGVKWSPLNKYFQDHFQEEAKWVQKTLDEQDSGIKISADAEDKLRKIFCIKIKMEEIQVRYPELHRHVSALKINGQPGFAANPWIFVQPD